MTPGAPTTRLDIDPAAANVISESIAARHLSHATVDRLSFRPKRLAQSLNCRTSSSNLFRRPSLLRALQPRFQLSRQRARVCAESTKHHVRPNALSPLHSGCVHASPRYRPGRFHRREVSHDHCVAVRQPSSTSERARAARMMTTSDVISATVLDASL